MSVFIDRTVGPPDAILTSSAVRARTTVETAAKERGWPCEVEVSTALYGASVSDAVREIRRTGDACETLLVAGHEPTWSALVGELIGGADIRMPTAAVACLEFEAESWKDIRRGCGLLMWHVGPKLLQSAGLEPGN